MPEPSAGVLDVPPRWHFTYRNPLSHAQRTAHSNGGRDRQTLLGARAAPQSARANVGRGDGPFRAEAREGFFRGPGICFHRTRLAVPVVSPYSSPSSPWCEPVLGDKVSHSAAHCQGEPRLQPPESLRAAFLGGVIGEPLAGQGVIDQLCEHTSVWAGHRGLLVRLHERYGIAGSTSALVQRH